MQVSKLFNRYVDDFGDGGGNMLESCLRDRFELVWWSFGNWGVGILGFKAPMMNIILFTNKQCSTLFF